MSSAIFVMVAIMSPTVVVTTVDPGSLFAKETQMCARGERVGGGYYLVGWLLFPGRDRKQVEYLVIEAEPRKIKGFYVGSHLPQCYLSVLSRSDYNIRAIRLGGNGGAESARAREREREREKRREGERKKRKKIRKGRKGRIRKESVMP